MNTGQSLPEFAVAFASPTEDQLNAMQLLEAFFQGESSCFLLKGYAGTGKTWLWHPGGCWKAAAPTIC